MIREKLDKWEMKRNKTAQNEMTMEIYYAMRKEISRDFF
jgi:hypothetical protein